MDRRHRNRIDGRAPGSRWRRWWRWWAARSRDRAPSAGSPTGPSPGASTTTPTSPRAGGEPPAGAGGHGHPSRQRRERSRSHPGAEGPVPAEDVNAADEVPCSTWFCARNHLHPMSLEEIAAGPPAVAPVPPFTITKGKDQGAATGFQVKDANGRKFMLKFDPAGHLGLATAAEMIGNRLFHAAGYNVPGAYLVEIDRAELQVDPRATFKLYHVRSGRSPRRGWPRSSPGSRACPTAACGRSSSPGSRQDPGRVRHDWPAAATIRTTASRTSTAGRCARAGCCSPGSRSSIRARSTRSTATSRRAGATSSGTTSSTSAAPSARRPRTCRVRSRTGST